jgi:hypothetical protein
VPQDKVPLYKLILILSLGTAVLKYEAFVVYVNVAVLDTPSPRFKDVFERDPALATLTFTVGVPVVAVALNVMSRITVLAVDRIVIVVLVIVITAVMPIEVDCKVPANAFVMLIPPTETPVVTTLQVPLFTSNTATSAAPGTDAPVAPPDVADQFDVLVVSQVPEPTQNLFAM